MKRLNSYNKNVFQPAERILKNFPISFMWGNLNNHLPLAYGSVVDVVIVVVVVLFLKFYK